MMRFGALVAVVLPSLTLFAGRASGFPDRKIVAGFEASNHHEPLREVLVASASTGTYLRVMVTSVPVHSGPGGSFREIGRVGMGQVYGALDRSPDGSWYRIRLARGISGWVLAELVWPFEVVDESVFSEATGWLDRHVFGPSRLAENQFLLSVSAGTLDLDGLFVFRVGFQPSPHYAIEFSAGESPSRFGTLLSYQLELLVMIGHWRTLVPFVAAGGGGATAFPGRNVRLFESDTHPAMSGGGGVLLALRGFTLRVDLRRLVVFSENESWGMLAATGGLMLVF